MEDFVVSARKYRPSTFKSVIGQESIVNTLKNEIAEHHLAHTFLFCGTRGVGKTSCARILAKTINCQNLTADTEACNTCESCKNFNEGRSLNIYELDAASNNSVEDIRQLIEQVRFAPQSGKYKVYIIDEVHMLSQAAFNAFLKTLEEPPEYAIFIMATTEKHKIIPTILSRCQIFDFKRIKLKDMAAHLAYISQQEGINAGPDALHIIAEKADGSMRDALSVYDQMVSFEGKTLTYKNVIDNLNILDYDYYFKITAHILKADASSVLLLFDEILSNGFDGQLFIGGLGEHFRNLIVAKNPSTAKLLEKGEQLKQRYTEQALNYPETLLFKGLNLINRCDINYKAAVNRRLLVEIALINLCNFSPDAPKTDAEASVNKVSAAKPVAVKPAATTTAPVAKPVAIAPQAATEQKPTPAKSETAPLTPETKRPPLFSVSRLMGETDAARYSKQQSSPDAPPSAPFTQDALLKAWGEYIQLHKEKKIALCSILGIANPKKLETEPTVIEIILSNTVQQKTVEESKTDLLNFLKNKLTQSHLKLQMVIAKTEIPHKPYTAEEKLNYMKSKNPEVENLQNELGLGLDI